ncbi:DUF4178 domain-containing protein [Epidermidibacterium keratini]|uniref:DUF4178 domain-containing protein n=1 Tax=Epidermidibacterium keratini TaxID=1891644 RepID=A0A7L4YQ95_9ACTN|nr:DUF4178 domain-containing protein [Epidermidibacterium keratini]QHC01192.1 DUF4178 domain-containing protein [Epidermidibacterium keratini]
MDPIVIVLIIVILALAVAGFILWKRQQDKQRKERRPAGVDPFSSADDDSVRGNPRTLKPGDIVEIRGTDYAVRGTLHLSEGSYSWMEAFLDTGVGDKMWLSVEDDPDLEVVVWREVKGATIQPGGRTVELDGRSYNSDESGEAQFVGEATTGLAERGMMRYHDYESGDGTRLSFEDFTGKWEVARGEVLRGNEYKIFPVNND